MGYPAGHEPSPADGVEGLLTQIADRLNDTFGGGSSSPVPVTPAGGSARTLTSTAATSSGTVAAGAKAVSFVTSSDWSGSVNGATRGASLAFSVSVINPADTLPAIAYIRSAGTLYIDALT